MNMIKAMLFLVLLFPMLVSALEMDDCHIGRTVYIDDWIDVEATIIEKDYSDNTVKIRIKENDETRWIEPSKLMGKIEKSVEDYAEGILEDVATSILECMFNQESCNKN